MAGKIIQIMPCNAEMYAKYECEFDNHSKYTDYANVLGFALDELGYIYPLVFVADEGIGVEDGTTSNFIGYKIGEHTNIHLTHISARMPGLK